MTDAFYTVKFNIYLLSMFKRTQLSILELLFFRVLCSLLSFSSLGVLLGGSSAQR